MSRISKPSRLGEILEQHLYSSDPTYPDTVKEAEAAINAYIADIIDTEYEADYQKLEPCVVCGDRQYSHAPDSHMEYGADQLREEQRKRAGL